MIYFHPYAPVTGDVVSMREGEPLGPALNIPGSNGGIFEEIVELT